MKPLARFLVAGLESQREGNGTPSMELAGARQFASFGLDLFKIGPSAASQPSRSCRAQHVGAQTSIAKGRRIFCASSAESGASRRGASHGGVCGTSVCCSKIPE